MPIPHKKKTPMRDFVRRFAQNRLAVLGAVIILVLTLTAIFAPLIAPYDPVFSQDYGNVLQSPGHGHLFGTDDLGRDEFSRLVFGARLSIQAALISVALAMVIGVPIGLITGYVGGIWDEWVVMRVVGGGFYNAMIAIGIGFLPSFIRITRAQVMIVKNLEYVQAAKAIGSSYLRIMFLHILPNTMGPLLVQMTLSMAAAVIAEAGLSYLGIGARPEQPSWGSMLSIAQGYLNVQPLLALWPGVAIFVVVLGFNLFGDGLREVLDPRLKR
jgi:peptide/nickel transport system permease protein